MHVFQAQLVTSSMEINIIHGIGDYSPFLLTRSYYCKIDKRYIKMVFGYSDLGYSGRAVYIDLNSQQYSTPQMDLRSVPT